MISEQVMNKNFSIIYLIEGFVQFIDSQPLRKVFERNRTIRQYLQSKTTVTDSEDTTLNKIGISHQVIDAYVKSCG